jgi:hypothetical protein
MTHPDHESRLRSLISDARPADWGLDAEDRCAIRWALDRIETLRDAARRDREPATLLDACRATLLFYGVQWTDAERQAWRNITGREEATTRILCDTIRAAIAAATKGATT